MSLVEEVAFAIWKAWAREEDQIMAERRFNRLAPAVRERFDAEAKAAIGVCEKCFAGDAQ